MGRMALFLGVLLLGLPLVSWGEDFVCADAQSQLREYIHSRDPSQVTDLLCTQVPKAQVPAQWALVRSSLGQCRYQGTYCYLKVAGGLAVEKTPAEQAAVDAAIAAAAAVRQGYRQEVQTQEYCSETSLDDLTAKMQAVEAGISTRLTPLITEATTVALLRQALAATAQEFRTLLAVDEKIARCVIALRFAR